MSIVASVRPDHDLADSNHRPRRSFGAALLGAFAAAVLGVAPAQAAASHGNAALAAGPRHHPMPIVHPGQAAAVPPRARLGYFGGRVVSNVQVVMVLWGAGTYAPFVTGAASPSLPSFFAGVTSSPYLDWFAQYDTTRPASGGRTGTNQHIGRGTFAGLVRIAPGGVNDGPRIDDANIVAELSVQLASGVLPLPVADAAGNANTVYAIHFPAGKTITVGDDVSCRTLCAYHGSFAWNGWSIYYMVMPDMSAGSGCDVGCGGGTPFGNATTVASHELAEAITDPEVGLAAVVGPPLAWYDPVNGEVADICNGLGGTVTDRDGVSYAVQRLWSNAEEACVVPGATPESVALGRPAASTGGAVTPAGASLARGMMLPRPRPDAADARIVTTSAQAPLAPPEQRSKLHVLASEPSDVPGGSGSRFTIEEENDALAIGPQPTDAFYTQGLRVSSRWASRAPLLSDAHELLGFAIGQNIYTPSDIRTTDLEALRHDRPYAGWLYAAFLWDLLLDRGPFSLRAGVDAPGAGASAFGVELAFGTTGPRSGAGAIQTSFHGLLRDLTSSTNPPDPAGWSLYQTANRATFDAALRYQLDVVQASATLGRATAFTGSTLSARVSPRARIDVGTTLDAAWLGVEVRTGLMTAPLRLRLRPSFPFELYAFGRADGRYVAHNGLIEGPLRDGVTTLVSIAPWVADLDAGVVLRLGGVELAYSQLWRTNELDVVPPGSRAIHTVGQARVSFVYP